MSVVTSNCPSTSRAVVKWKYPGEPQQQRYANEYEITGALLRTEVVVTYKKFNFSSETNYGFFSYGFDNQVEAFFSSVVGTRVIIAKDRNREYAVWQNPQAASRLPYSSALFQEVEAAKPGFRPIEHPTTNHSISSTGSIVRWTIVRELGWHISPTGVVLNIRDNGNLLYSRTTTVLPESIGITCEQQQCPPNTCEVECGNTICCYGSDGISVLNFPKP
ncbi:MAG: hypothetical protein ACRDBG_22305 [Waterburya sp.]